MRALMLAALSLTVLCGPVRSEDDPHLWLEDLQGAAPRAWVRAHNEHSEQLLQASPRYGPLHEGIRGVLESPQRIPQVTQLGGHLYNFWRDAQHPRGLWRRTTLVEYRRPAPAWQTVLDLDRLAADEQENWVWAGVSCLTPQAGRCLVSLSRGGGDAHVVREFDLETGRFVADGFHLPEAKGGAAWVDRDTLTVYTDFGPGSMTASGYPRKVKLWRRGTPLAQAGTLFEASPDDVGVWTWSDLADGGSQHLIERRTSFFAGEQYLLRKGELVAVPKPADASTTPFGDQLLIELRSDWTVGGATHAAGSLLAIKLDDFLSGDRRFATLFKPRPGAALQQFERTRSAVLLVSMEQVRQKLTEWRRVQGRWVQRTLPTEAFANLNVSPLAGQHTDQYLLTHSGFLTPTSLYLGEAGSARRSPLKALPAFFDAKPFEVQQLQARSRDGTAVPYFIVMPRGGAATTPPGGRPTLLYGYGGFEISMKPGYSGIIGRSWLERGGVYVLANLRGGGEFGPRWHQSAQKQHRQRSYDDFIAVAEDLVRRGITSPPRLGIMGGSLGGMLVSVAMVQRPELFGAVVSQVPLTDMKRYHKLLAGASWMEEYGDPDVPEQWSYIGAYSPYHNSRAGQPYPPVLYTSSTRDDRVHPAHARKMVARLQDQGHSVLYWENTEGGHAGAANSAQQAQMWALSYTFLWEALKR